METIGDRKIWTKDYETFYQTSMDLTGRMAGSGKEAISRLVCDESSPLSTALKPENHYAQYRDTLIIAQVAKDEGFLDKTEVKLMMEQSRLQTIAQLYINEKIMQKVKISKEEKLKTCQELRAQEPSKMAPLSLEDCLDVAAGVLKRRRAKEKGAEILGEIKEQIAVKKNGSFNKDVYLERMPLYRDIRKEGNCPLPPLETEQKKESSSDSDKAQKKDKK